MKREDFYIGWSKEIPARTGRFIKVLVAVLLAFTIATAFLVSWLQKPFNNHKFELGKVVQIQGTYYDSPFPVLVAEGENLPLGISPVIMLVGYGKFGADGIMNNIQQKTGSLSGHRITLTGTLIYGSGKTLMELTKKENSLVSVSDERPLYTSLLKAGDITKITGEILDPKCYFGVMKPGEGKVHKSCAIRCISGGIPPVLRHETGDATNPYQYYVLLAQNGTAINKEILPFVAEITQVTGVATNFEGWDILYCDLNTLGKVP